MYIRACSGVADAAAASSVDALRRCNGASIQFPELCQARSERRREKEKERDRLPRRRSPLRSVTLPRFSIRDFLLAAEFGKTKPMRVFLSLSLYLPFSHLALAGFLAKAVR